MIIIANVIRLCGPNFSPPWKNFLYASLMSVKNMALYINFKGGNWSSGEGGLGTSPLPLPK